LVHPSAEAAIRLTETEEAEPDAQRYCDERMSASMFALLAFAS